jgi:hypothetical protein
MLVQKGMCNELGQSPHLSEAQFEGYATDILRDAEVQVVEEHLLVCPSCQRRQLEVDAFFRAMRHAALAERESAKRFPWAVFPKPVWALAAVMATLLVAVVVLPRPERAAPVVVLLESTRGADSIYAKALAQKPLLLELDIAGLPAANFYRVEIVNARGNVIRETVATLRDGKVGAPPPLELAPGRYFIRLYSRNAELLREYGLETTAR